MTNGVNTSATATAEVQLGGRLKALDELLVGKNRKLQDENVELRMRNQSLEGRLIFLTCELMNALILHQLTSNYEECL